MTSKNTPAFSDPANTWNQRFAAPGFLFGAEPNGWLREHAHVWSPGEQVLCVADGEGRNSVWLAEQGLKVDAFDIAATGVAKDRELAAQRGVTVNFAVADCDAYAWPDAALDGVAAIFVQFADPDLRARLFTNMVRSLKPGGWLVLQGYTPGSLTTAQGGRPWCRTSTQNPCCGKPLASSTLTPCENTKPSWPRAAVTMAALR